MTVDRSYRCNLCHTKCEPDDLTGIYWTDCPGAIEFRAARDVEHHICKHCLGSIARLVNNNPEEGVF